VKLLLDTCAFLWIAADAPELSTEARRLFTDPANEVYLSAVSTWEVALKYRLGRLPLPEPPGRLVAGLRAAHGIAALALEEDAALQEAKLPPLHRDPFDRMLVCQAIVHGLVVLTPDPAVAQYPIRVAW